MKGAILLPFFFFHALITDVLALKLPAASLVQTTTSNSSQTRELDVAQSMEIRLWDGEDVQDDDNSNSTLASKGIEGTTALAASEGPQVSIFGLYNSGTNVLQMVLHAGFPHGSICPDTALSKTTAASGGTCKHGPRISKHTNPFYIENDWLPKSDKASRAVLIMRNPLSNLLSCHDHPYALFSCAGPKIVNWVSTSCSCHMIVNHSPWDMMCKKFQHSFSSVAAVWNTFAGEYARLQELHPDRVKIVRYEDLVLEPDTFMSQLAQFLTGAPPASSSVKQVMQSSAKKSNGVGRQAALKKLQTKSYLHDEGYSATRLQQLCARLDKTLMKRFGYTDDCN